MFTLDQTDQPVDHLDQRRRQTSRLLCYGSLALALAISLTFVAAEITRTLDLPHPWFPLIVYGNALLPAIGCGYGTILGRDRPGRRLVTSLAAASAGAACYAGGFFIGLIGIITAANTFLGHLTE